MGFFANMYWTIIFPVLAIIAAWIGISLLRSGMDKRDKGEMLGGILCILLCLLLAAGYGFSATHGIVPVNKRALVTSWATGQIIGETRSSGLTTLPLWTGDVLVFNGGRDEQVCFDFTPSVQGGYEVVVTTCFYLDLGMVDWVNQYRRYANEYESLLSIWQNQLAQYVAVGVKQYRPQDLTENRDEVASKIEANVQPWFVAEGIPFSRVFLKNWDFTNEKVAQSYDETIIAQTKVIVATADYNAAIEQRKVDTFIAETANQVLEMRTSALLEAIDDLGIYSEESRIDYLLIQWLTTIEDPSMLRALVLNMGRGEVQPVVPVTE